MGIFDFVKSGTQEMAIARPDHAKKFLVYKHPDQTIPMYAQLTVDSDECAVFFKEGVQAGVLGPGRHTMQTSNIPFLSNFVDKFTGGNLWIAEVFFVKTMPHRGEDTKFGGPIGVVKDAPFDQGGTGLTVRPRIFGECTIQIVDPVAFILKYHGQQSHDSGGAPNLDYIRGLLRDGAKQAIGQLFSKKEISLLDVAAATSVIRERIVQNTPPEIAEVGIKVVGMGSFSLNFSEDDEAKIMQAHDDFANQERANRLAKMRIEERAAEGQGEAAYNQSLLDQQFNKDARYVQQLAGNYQNYAAGQAMMGMGQGMAKGEGVAAPMMMMGANMGGNVMNQFGQPMGGMPQYQPQFGGPPPMPGAAPPPPPAAPVGPPLFFAANGQQQGPFPNAQALAQALISQLGPQGANIAQVWQQGWPGWRPANSLPEVANMLNNAMPPPPPPMAAPVETFHVQFADGVTQVQGVDALRSEIQKRGMTPAQVMIWKPGMPGWGPASGVLG